MSYFALSNRILPSRTHDDFGLETPQIV